MTFWIANWLALRLAFGLIPLWLCGSWLDLFGLGPFGLALLALAYLIVPTWAIVEVSHCLPDKLPVCRPSDAPRRN